MKSHHVARIVDEVLYLMTHDQLEGPEVFEGEEICQKGIWRMAFFGLQPGVKSET